MPHITIPPELLQSDYNGDFAGGLERKAQFHVAGVGFLKSLAAELRLDPACVDIQSKPANKSVSGAVTLQSDDLHLTISEPPSDNRLVLFFKMNDGRPGFENKIPLESMIDEETQAAFIAKLISMSPLAQAGATRSDMLTSLESQAAPQPASRRARPRI